MHPIAPEALGQLLLGLQRATREPTTRMQVSAAAGAFRHYIDNIGWQRLDEGARARALGDVLWSAPFNAAMRHAMAAPTGSRRAAACPRGGTLPPGVAAMWRQVCGVQTLRERGAALVGAAPSADPVGARNQLSAARTLGLAADAGARDTLRELRRAYLEVAVGWPAEGPKMVSVFNALMDEDPTARLPADVLRDLPHAVVMLLTDTTGASGRPTSKQLERAAACMRHLARARAADPGSLAASGSMLQEAQEALDEALRLGPAPTYDVDLDLDDDEDGGPAPPVGTSAAAAGPPAGTDAPLPCAAGRRDIRHVRDFDDFVGLRPELVKYVNEARARGQAPATPDAPHVHLLLLGSSGGGKTYLAQAVAKTLGVDMYMAGSALRSTHTDGSTIRLAAWLAQIEQHAARQQKLAYVLFDELHSWMRRTDGHAPEDGKFVTYLLQTLDGGNADAFPHIVFVGATNYPGQVGDETLRRFVRIDVGAPTPEQLGDQLRWSLRRRLGLARTGPTTWVGDGGAAARLEHLGRYLLGMSRNDVDHLVHALPTSAALPGPEAMRQQIIARRADALGGDGRVEDAGGTQFTATVRLPNLLLPDASKGRLAIFRAAGHCWSLQLSPQPDRAGGGLSLRCLQDPPPALHRVKLTFGARPPAPATTLDLTVPAASACSGLWHIGLAGLHTAGLDEAPGTARFRDRFEVPGEGIELTLTAWLGRARGPVTRARYDLGVARGAASAYETLARPLAVRVEARARDAANAGSHDPVPGPVESDRRVQVALQLARPAIEVRLLRDPDGWPQSATLRLDSGPLEHDRTCRLVARGTDAEGPAHLHAFRAALAAGEIFVRLEPAAPDLIDTALARPGRDVFAAGRIGLLIGQTGETSDQLTDALSWHCPPPAMSGARPEE